MHIETDLTTASQLSSAFVWLETASSGHESGAAKPLFWLQKQRGGMSQDSLTECPFCDFEPDVPHEDVNSAPEQVTHRVHQHVEKEHSDRTDELDTYTSPG